MMCKAKVNRIIEFTNILHKHLEAAHAGIPEPELLVLLKGSRQVTYVGMPLLTDLEDWAISEGILSDCSSRSCRSTTVKSAEIADHEYQGVLDD